MIYEISHPRKAAASARTRFAILLAALAAALVLSGCVAVPSELESSIHALHEGNVLLGAKFLDLLSRANMPVEAQRKWREILSAHLAHSSAVNAYVNGKGGRIVPLWHKGEGKVIDE